jgi:hypothetical protein
MAAYSHPKSKSLASKDKQTRAYPATVALIIELQIATNLL